MADTIDTGENLGSIFKILSDANTQAAQNSPYAQPLQILGQAEQGPLNPLARNPYTGQLQASPGMAGLSGLAMGLMGGIGQGLQNNYVATQGAQASDLMKQALAGQDIGQMPDGMNPSVFSNIKNFGSIFQRELGMQQYMHNLGQQDQARQELFKARPDLAAQYLQTGKVDTSGGATGILTPSGYSQQFLAAHNINPNSPKADVEEALKQSEKTSTTSIPAQGGIESIDRLINMVDGLPDSSMGRALEGVSPITNKTNFFDDMAHSQSAALAKQLEGRVNDVVLQSYMTSMARQTGDSKQDMKNRLVNAQLWLSRIAQGDTTALKMDAAQFAKSRGVNPSDIGIPSSFGGTNPPSSTGGVSINDPAIQADIQRLKQIPGMDKDQARQAINSKYGTNF